MKKYNFELFNNIVKMNIVERFLICYVISLIMTILFGFIDKGKLIEKDFILGFSFLLAYILCYASDIKIKKENIKPII